MNTKNYSYLETSGVQSSDLYLNSVHFFNNSVSWTSVQLKTVVFLHWCALLLLYLLHLIKSSNLASFSAAWQCFSEIGSLLLMQAKHEVTRGQASWAKMTSPRGKPAAAACHLIVSRVTYLSIYIKPLLNRQFDMTSKLARFTVAAKIFLPSTVVAPAILRQ